MKCNKNKSNGLKSYKSGGQLISLVSRFTFIWKFENLKIDMKTKSIHYVISHM